MCNSFRMVHVGTTAICGVMCTNLWECKIHLPIVMKGTPAIFSIIILLFVIDVIIRFLHYKILPIQYTKILAVKIETFIGKNHY